MRVMITLLLSRYQKLSPGHVNFIFMNYVDCSPGCYCHRAETFAMPLMDWHVDIAGPRLRITIPPLDWLY